MMIGTEYKIAASETLSILQNMNVTDVKKIPQSFLDFLEELSAKDYTPELDYSKSIEELELKEKTREILGYIYINWWSTKKEKIICEEIINTKKKNSNISVNAKYEPDEIFKIKKNNTEDKKMIEYKKETFIKKIMTKILQFFKKNQRRK